MGQNIHLERQGDTTVNIHGNTDLLQLAITTDGQEGLIWANDDASKYLHAAIQKHWNGAAYVFEDNDFNDVEIHGDLLISADIMRALGTDDKITFANDRISIDAGGVEALVVEDDKIYSNVDVGIGDANPLNKLTVKVDSSDGTSTAHGVRIGTVTTVMTLGVNDTGNYLWMQGTAGLHPIALQPNGGNVGAGTVAPVAGVDILKNHATEPGLKVRQDGAGDIASFFDGVAKVVSIADGGGVGIGVAPSYKLDVLEATTAVYASHIKNSISTGKGLIIEAGDTGQEALNVANYLGASKFKVLGNGRIYGSAGFSKTVVSADKFPVFFDPATNEFEHFEIPSRGTLAGTDQSVFYDTLTDEYFRFTGA